MLITELGYFALIAAMMLAVLQVVLPTWGVVRKQVSLQRLAPSLAWAQFVAMLFSFAALMAGFYYNDFSLLYVTEHSNTLLPWYYRISADVHITVSDNVLGISAEMLPKIFELFTQVDNDLSRTQGGLGIGLALVKRLVEMHLAAYLVRIYQ